DRGERRPMNGDDPLRHLWIIGPGRLGLALGWQLCSRHAAGSVVFIGLRPSPPAHPVFTECGAAYHVDAAHAPNAPSAILIAVPDASIEAVGLGLGALALPPVPVLHSSGVLSS